MSNSNQNKPRGPQREPILAMADLLHKKVFVQLIGQLAVEGTLAGYDSLMNLVLTDVTEVSTGDKHAKVVVRGLTIATLEPLEGGQEPIVVSKPEAVI